MNNGLLESLHRRIDRLDEEVKRLNEENEYLHSELEKARTEANHYQILSSSIGEGNNGM